MKASTLVILTIGVVAMGATAGWTVAAIVGGIILLGWLTFFVLAAKEQKAERPADQDAAPALELPGTAPRRPSSRDHQDTVLAEGLSRGLRISYRDAEGNVTERTITVHRLLGDLSGRRARPYRFRYLDAYCHLRKEARTFRVDRILALEDQTTGEVVEGGQPDSEERLWRYFAELVPDASVRRGA